MGKCLKCTAYKFLQFGRRVIVRAKTQSVMEEVQGDSKYTKKVKIIYGKSK